MKNRGKFRYLEKVCEVRVVAAALRLEIGEILEIGTDHQQVIHHFFYLRSAGIHGFSYNHGVVCTFFLARVSCYCLGEVLLSFVMRAKSFVRLYLISPFLLENLGLENEKTFV